jgi:hypothetical protein
MSAFTFFAGSTQKSRRREKNKKKDHMCQNKYLFGTYVAPRQKESQNESNTILKDMYDHYTMSQAPSKEPTDSLHVGICAPNNNHFYLLIVSIQNQLIN